jgi:hypothetical protein
LVKWRYLLAAVTAILIAPLLASLPHGPDYYLYFLYVFLPGWLASSFFGALILAAMETYKRQHWILSTLGGATFGTLGSLMLGGGLVEAAPFALAGGASALLFHAIVFWLPKPSPATAP